MAMTSNTMLEQSGESGHPCLILDVKENWTDTCKKKKEKEKERKKKLDHILALYTRIDSKWIKDLNVHPHTIKLLEENESSNLSDIATSNLFLDVPP